MTTAHDMLEDPDRPWADPRALGIATTDEERAVLNPKINPANPFRLAPVRQPTIPSAAERMATLRRRRGLW
jgi:hypothetical protein